jgi:hypothetical protein
VARYRCSLNRLPRAQKKLPASAGYRGSDLVLWHEAAVSRAGGRFRRRMKSSHAADIVERPSLTESGPRWA